MLRGGKNYKKKKQMPDWDVDKLEKIMRDAVSNPPKLVKQPFDTNQPYTPAEFGHEKNETTNPWKDKEG